MSPIKGDLKARFSDPPAPPPQQPLPEKPDAHQPSFRRTDTARPKADSSPIRSDSHPQISSLADALTSAKKEIESQSLRLKDLEELLAQEKIARESAEERAQRFERESLGDRGDAKVRDLPDTTTVNGISHVTDLPTESEQNETSTSENDSSSPTMSDAATARLQQRLELMVAEMDEMKQQMDNYRQRAETAEAENATHRKTLAEMVEKIRQDDSERALRAAKKRLSRSDSDSGFETASASIDGREEDEAEEGEITIIREKDLDGDAAGSLLRRASVQNGRPVSPEQAAELEKVISHALATRPIRQDAALTHGGPAASIFGIVLIGVGLMAWLNSYPKVER